jgi:crotonobetainyl-CoA:carnitine CoA-transferase CaiB-like acyl-CoA transferase
MFEATAEWLGHPMYVQMYDGRQLPRMGLSHAAIAPYDAYPTADGEILIGIQNDRGWRTLVTEVFNRRDLVDDARFATNILRVAHRAECDEAVATHTRTWTTADLNARLAEVGIPAAQVNSVRGLVEHPQLQARRRWRTIGTENGPVDALLPPATFDDVEAAMGSVPALGEHTTDLLREAGLDDDQISQLIAADLAFQHRK